MKETRILYALERADEEYIEEAAPAKGRTGKAVWIRWAAAAACLCLIIGGMYLINRPKGPAPVGPGGETTPVDPGGETAPVNPDDTTPHGGGDVTPVDPGGETYPAVPGELPKITVPVVDPKAQGGGFESLRYFRPDDLQSGNPWSEDIELETLPVYKNGTFDRTGAGVPRGHSEEEMMEKLRETLDAINAEALASRPDDAVGGEKGDDGAVNNEINGVEAAADIGIVRVFANGRTILLPEDGTLPEGYSFNLGTSDQEQEKAMKYLVEKYAGFLNYGNPEILYLESSYDNWYMGFIVYDAAEDITERILNYNFRTAEFTPDGRGNLQWITCFDGLCKAEKIGDYPLISVSEAREKLLDGKYQSRNLPDIRGEEYIAKVDLVYRSGWMEETLLPYYRFWVEAEGPEEAEGYQAYGFYYVPAIQDEYISNSTTWFGVK